MAFMKDRQIMDSLVIAGEIIHSWKTNSLFGLLVKLDFEKAYESVDHEFLFEIFSRMGFGNKWVEWIRWCATSLLLSVLVNGCQTKEFSIERGLYQGDPLSPLLFYMVVEVLSRMFNKAKEHGIIKWIGYKNDAMHITHL
ncbi:hypothetical protein Ddye_014481 [Dipteronia dyeriana]|uniref:Reverse transcriptase domain-containing protein n=1 Tax=Dipteronia dyeriana TaxID=168575 RepID=A0AAE0CKK5_9ROSI|nr:hypothetical protein Ddye_014481 [Dipteronia dyeriana]